MAIVKGIKSEIETDGPTEAIFLTLDDEERSEEVGEWLKPFLEVKGVSKNDLNNVHVIKMYPDSLI